jgi:hypothetical protein
MMKQALWPNCKIAGMSVEYYNYLIDPETLEIRNLSEDHKHFKKISGRIRFNTVKTKDAKDVKVIKSGTEQKELLKFLLTNGSGYYCTPKKILICSEHTDKIPMIIASCMAQFYINGSSTASPIFTNTYTKFNNENRPVLTAKYSSKEVGHNHATIYGLSSTSTDYKFQEVRDVISSITWPCSVVLVAGGVPNPVEFYKKKLNMEMDSILSIADSIQI